MSDAPETAPKKWRLVELTAPKRAIVPLETQPTYIMQEGSNYGRILLPTAFLAGFDKDCPLVVGCPDPTPLKFGVRSMNVAEYDFTKEQREKLRDWRCWDTIIDSTSGHELILKQLHEAIEYWYEHNTPSEVDTLLAEANAMCNTTLVGSPTTTKGEETMSTETPQTIKAPGINWEQRRDIALPDLPVHMNPEEAAKHLLDKAKEDSEEVAINETIVDCFPWDGAVQFSRAMGQLHGWGRVKASEIQTMFGTVKRPPVSIAVEVDPGVHEEVLWGEFSIPGITGKLNCGIDKVAGRIVFCIKGTVIKRDLPLVRQLADLTRKYVKERSIYKGKAIQLVLHDEGQVNWSEQPRFLKPPVTVDDLIFSADILDQIDTHLIAPIKKRELLEQIGCPFGGAVLLSGTYGVGKTVLAAAIANECVDAAVTYIDVQSLNAVQEVLIAARPLGPAVVFVEDIDRISKEAERNEATQEIMNTLASVSSKGAQVMAVFTTNKPGAIHPALVQRFSGVVVIDPPQAPEVEKLIRLYGKELVSPDEDLNEASMYLSGKVPRTIEQIVQASKKYSVSRNGVADIKELRIIGRDLIGAAKQKEFQLQLESRSDEKVYTPAEQVGMAMEAIVSNKMSETAKLVKAIAEHLDI